MQSIIEFVRSIVDGSVGSDAPKAIEGFLLLIFFLLSAALLMFLYVAMMRALKVWTKLGKKQLEQIETDGHRPARALGKEAQLGVGMTGSIPLPPTPISGNTAPIQPTVGMTTPGLSLSSTGTLNVSPPSMQMTGSLPVVGAPPVMNPPANRPGVVSGGINGASVIGPAGGVPAVALGGAQMMQQSQHTSPFAPPLPPNGSEAMYPRPAGPHA